MSTTRPSCSLPTLRDWLPSGHLAWFVLDVVDQLDLGPFLKAYRADRHGGCLCASDAAGVLPYAYCTGMRSPAPKRTPLS